MNEKKETIPSMLKGDVTNFQKRFNPISKHMLKINQQTTLLKENTKPKLFYW